MKGIQAIRTYFEKDGGRKVAMEELKALSAEERAELGKMACTALGVEYEAAQ